MNDKTKDKTQPIYLLRLQPVHGDGVHALRRLLKYALRACRLRAISVIEETNDPAGNKEGAAP